MVRVEQLRNNELFYFNQPQILNMFNPVYDDLFEIEHFCTMRAGVNICNIMTPRKNGNGMYKKWPTLLELYQHLFSQTPENLHNSMVDALVGLRCFLKIRHHITMTDADFGRLMSDYLV
jgi:hypothetical protein